MKILQFNSRSLNTSQHRLQDYIQFKGFDILCITEIWDSKKLTRLKEYVPVLKDRGKRGGGASIFRHKSVKLVENKNFEKFDIEAVWADTVIENKRCILGSVYIPQTDQSKKIDILEKAIASIPETLPVIITGDLNCRSTAWEKFSDGNKNTVAWNLGKKMEKIITKYGFQILNTGAHTRQGSGVRSSPDVTIHRGFSSIPKWTTDEKAQLSSDHFPILIEYKSEKKIAERWRIEQANWTQWNSSISNATNQWLQRSEEKNATEAIESLT